MGKPSFGDLLVFFGLLCGIALGAYAIFGCSPVQNPLPRFGACDDFARAPVAKNLVRGADFDVALNDGKISWWVKCKNTDTKTAYFVVVMDINTTGGKNIEMRSSWTLEPGLTETMKISDKPVDGLAAGESVATVGCMMIPGAGCETPTTRVKGNWPKSELTDTYHVAPLPKQGITYIPAPTLGLGIDGMEINAEGGTSLEWHTSAKNNEARAIELHIQAVFVTDSGEKLSPREMIFQLGAGEQRTISGPTIRSQKPFRSVDGTANVVGKKYPEPINGSTR